MAANARGRRENNKKSERERERESRGSWTLCSGARVRSTLKGLWLASVPAAPALSHHRVPFTYRYPPPPPPPPPLRLSLSLSLFCSRRYPRPPRASPASLLVDHPVSHPTASKTTLPPAAILLSPRPGLAKL